LKLLLAQSNLGYQDFTDFSCGGDFLSAI